MNFGLTHEFLGKHYSIVFTAIILIGLMASFLVYMSNDNVEPQSLILAEVAKPLNFKVRSVIKWCNALNNEELIYN